MVGSQWTKRHPTVGPNDGALSSYVAPEIIQKSQQVDNAFVKHWEQCNLRSADKADNLLIIRRLSLGLTGTVPSLEKIRVVESIDPYKQLQFWLEDLLADRRFSDYVAERLARSCVGTEEGPFILFRRRRFVSWLSDCLLENKPYDQIASALISDRGTWTDFPSVNFITVTNGTNEKDQPDPVRLAGRTARAFLGCDLIACNVTIPDLGGMVAV